VREAADEYGIQPGRLIAVGFSNGATIAVSLLLASGGLLASAVLFRGVLPLEPAIRPDLRGVGVYIGAARDDETMGPEGPERLAAFLRDAGADVALWWDRGGHQLTPQALAPARRWLRERLDWRGAPAP
jgi:phospholipase/carboxylesterase/glyoxalase family protein